MAWCQQCEMTRGGMQTAPYILGPCLSHTRASNGASLHATPAAPAAAALAATATRTCRLGPIKAGPSFTTAWLRVSASDCSRPAAQAGQPSGPPWYSNGHLRAVGEQAVIRCRAHTSSSTLPPGPATAPQLPPPGTPPGGRCSCARAHRPPCPPPGPLPHLSSASVSASGGHHLSRGSESNQQPCLAPASSPASASKVPQPASPSPQLSVRSPLASCSRSFTRAGRPAVTCSSCALNACEAGAGRPGQVGVLRGAGEEGRRTAWDLAGSDFQQGMQHSRGAPPIVATATPAPHQAMQRGVLPRAAHSAAQGLHHPSHRVLLVHPPLPLHSVQHHPQHVRLQPGCGEARAGARRAWSGCRQ